MKIDEKRAIVTGGAKGIGRCIAERLASEGAKVGVFDIDAEALKGLGKEHPRIHGEPCDVSDQKQVERAVENFCRKYDGIDVLVNTAGLIHNSPLIGINEGGFVKYDINEWDKTIKVNLYSVFYTAREVVMKMVEKRIRGVIINIGSIAADGNVGQTAYSAAKAGVHALTAVWARELSSWNIRVAGVAPGFTNTESVTRSTKKNIIDEWIRKTPLRRMAEPQEISDGILFIIKNDFFNGRMLVLDGGLRI